MSPWKIIAAIAAIGVAGSFIPEHAGSGDQNNAAKREERAAPSAQKEHEKWLPRSDAAINEFAKSRGIGAAELADRAGTSVSLMRDYVARSMSNGEAANQAIEALLDVAMSAKNQKQNPEMVAVYLGEHGDPKILVDLSLATAVIYQERKCNLEAIPFYQRMRYATMNGVPVCAFKSGSSAFIVGAGNPVELPEPFFAQAWVTPDGASAQVINQNYDGKAAAKEWMDQQQAEIRKQIRGAPKPPRDNGAQ